jgi:molybdopterin-guanine dinucleotide biosynthesis protein B
MRVVGIVGYKKSGKTTLLVKIARELTMRGYTVASLKHVSDHLDLPATDTSLHRQFTIQTAAIGPKESAIFFQESKNIEQMLSYLQADFVLVEGFKTEKTYPKIICLRQDDDPETLMDGLQICAVSDNPDKFSEINVPILNPESDISKITDLIEQKAFKLPNLNCGGCGCDNCYELALEIIKGKRSIDDCVALNTDIKIEIDGQVMPLNPFVAKLMSNTIKAMLSSLKNYHNGKVEIHIDTEKS